jgi:hypothetical protein
MKTKIFFLGLAALSFCTNSNANSASTFQGKNADQIQTIKKRSQIDTIGEKERRLENEIFDPSSIFLTNSVPTIEERIKDDQQITEFIPSIAQYMSLEFTLEDRIQEYNQIIENSPLIEVSPLNFDIINQLTIDSIKANKNSVKINELKL